MSNPFDYKDIYFCMLFVCLFVCLFINFELEFVNTPPYTLDNQYKL